MTKKEFIAQSVKMGFKRYQDLVLKLGYNERTLSRYKDDALLPDRFINKLEAYKHDAQPIKKKELKDIKIEKAQNEHKKSTKLTQKEKCAFGLTISNEDYHNSGKMSTSKLKVLIENAREFKSKYIDKTIDNKATDALIVGRLHHTLVLEPHKFDKDYIVLDLPARPIKNDYIKALEVLGGELDLKESKGEMIIADTIDTLKEKIEKQTAQINKTICTKAHLELAQQTAKKALESTFELIVGQQTLLCAQLKDLLQYEKCYVERTFFGNINDVDVQIRPDIIINLGIKNDVWFVIDLKTIDTATPKEFAQQGGKYFWDMQEAFYLEVLRQNGIIPKAFYFNCAGKKEFSGAQFYEWGETSKLEAHKVLRAGLNKYKYCIENNLFLEAKFDYKNLRFEAITTLEVPIYRQYTLGDLGV